ncbi:hypothetical protein J6590_074912, partial [Homalodisca vitripennis]
EQANRQAPHLKEIKFLGHLISKDEIKIDQDRTKAITVCEPPKNAKERLVVYRPYRDFGQSSDEIVRLFSNLLSIVVCLVMIITSLLPCWVF